MDRSWSRCDGGVSIATDLAKSGGQKQSKHHFLIDAAEEVDDLKMGSSLRH